MRCKHLTYQRAGNQRASLPGGFAYSREYVINAITRGNEP